ncbi:hypothetical protein [Mycobacteroides abscessus]|uniref:hypothetical protein n=1 Tax=Mycobacteroides abscessus TaxID=36809 RepID=UPI0005E1DBB5|nr:hypothetical protein [Mycobacteroides abscessus]CPX80878.1 Uncharacterised protein [Mycobacteroides abscessus]
MDEGLVGMVCRFLRHQSVCTATVFALIGVCVLSACGQTPGEVLADELNDIYREVAQAVQKHNLDAYNALTCARQHLDGIDSIKSDSAADLPATGALTAVSVHGDAALATLAAPPGIARELAEGYRVAFLKENEGWKYCGGLVAVGIASARSSGRR